MAWSLRAVLCLKSGYLLGFVILYKSKGERTECKNYKLVECGWKYICEDLSR